MRKCIFCDNQALTKEDAWPLWLIRLINRDPGRIEAVRGKQDIESWRVDTPEIRVKYVCADCNNGWMSNLENRVKPIVEKLLDEEQVILNTMSQEIVATWAVKTAMVLETLRKESSWFFVESERKKMKGGLNLPEFTSVWIAKCVEFGTFFSKASDLTGFVQASKEPVKAYVTTMGFGSLAIQVLSGRFTHNLEPITRITANLRPGPWKNIALQIWPIQEEPVIWPTSTGLQGELGLETFSMRWG